MALTITPVGLPSVFGDKRVRFADVTFDTSYTTGGLALVPKDVGFARQIDLLIAAPSGGFIFEFDHAAQKLKAQYPTGGATAAPTTAQGAVPGVASGGTAV